MGSRGFAEAFCKTGAICRAGSEQRQLAGEGEVAEGAGGLELVDERLGHLRAGVGEFLDGQELPALAGVHKVPGRRFTKTGHGGTDNVWFYDMKADGFSLDDKRSPTTENDIPDIIARFHNREAEATRERTEQSFFVPKDEIAGNDYDLSINKYKKTEYVPVEYPSTQEIMAQLRDLQKKIDAEMDALEELLK